MGLGSIQQAVERQDTYTVNAALELAPLGEFHALHMVRVRVV